MIESLSSDAQSLFGRMYRLFETSAPDNPDRPVDMLNKVATWTKTEKWDADVAFGLYLVARWLSIPWNNTEDIPHMLNIFVPRAARWLNRYGSRGTLGLFPKNDVQTYTHKIWQLIKAGYLDKLLVVTSGK